MHTTRQRWPLCLAVEPSGPKQWLAKLPLTRNVWSFATAGFLPLEPDLWSWQHAIQDDHAKGMPPRRRWQHGPFRPLSYQWGCSNNTAQETSNDLCRTRRSKLDSVDWPKTPIWIGPEKSGRVLEALLAMPAKNFKHHTGNKHNLFALGLCTGYCKTIWKKVYKVRLILCTVR